jgi:hypothetical protein
LQGSSGVETALHWCSYNTQSGGWEPSFVPIRLLFIADGATQFGASTASTWRLSRLTIIADGESGPTVDTSVETNTLPG